MIHRMEFLSTHRVKDGGIYNHVLLSQPFGKYNIPREARKDLHQLIHECCVNDVDFGLCECHDETNAETCYYDLDFTMTHEACVEDKHIGVFIRILNQILITHTDVPPDLLHAYVMRKPCAVEMKGQKWHVGVHIQFPLFRLHATERLLIYHILLKELRQQGVFSDLPLKETRVEEIVDSRVITTNSILKYGCNKEKKLRYRLHHIYNAESQLIEGPPFADDLVSMSAFMSIHREAAPVHSFKDTAAMHQLKQEYLVAVAPTKPVAQSPTSNTIPRAIRNIDPETKERVRRLLCMLSKTRSESYDSWIQVSLCLHNISNSEDMYEVWKSWSTAGCPEKATATNFKRIWNSFHYKENGLKLGSLSLWAKADSPNDFYLYKIEEIDRRLRRTLDGNTSYDIAKVLKEMYDGIYVCSDIKAHTWYEFRKHSYVEIQEAYTLFINISEELVQEYQKKCATLYGEMQKLMNESRMDECKDIEKKIEIVQLMIQRLKTASFKQTIMTEARMLFYDETFEKKLNESRHLLVFNNGVYDLDRQEFRQGFAEDYMSFTTGINYREYNPNDDDIAKVEHIIREMHPEEDNYEFLMSVLASGLHGIKREQKLDIWTGTGSNGKSIMIDFLSKSLGDYYESPPILMLTRRRGSSANASPDLYKLKGKRIVSFSEPEFDDTLHMSIVKQLFGNDWIEARPLFKGPVKFKPQATGLLACNDLPKIPCNDGGTWRRIRALKFKYKFTNEPTEPHHRKSDPRLPEQIDSLAEAFMCILIHHWCKVINEKGGIIEDPPEVKAFTAQYQMESDVYLEYIKENIRDAEDPKARIGITTIFDHFRYWCRTNASWHKPQKNELKRQLILRLGEPKANRGWEGKRLVSNNDENEGGF